MPSPAEPTFNVSEKTRAVVSSYEEHVAGGFGPLPVSHQILKCSFDRLTLFQVALVRAQNATAWDVDGKPYLDFVDDFLTTL